LDLEPLADRALASANAEAWFLSGSERRRRLRSIPIESRARVTVAGVNRAGGKAAIAHVGRPARPHALAGFRSLFLHSSRRVTGPGHRHHFVNVAYAATVAIGEV